MTGRSPLNPAPSLSRGPAGLRPASYGGAMAARPPGAHGSGLRARSPAARWLARLEEQVGPVWRRHVAGATGLVLFAVAAAFAVALATWSITDPSFSHATAEPARNALGFLGASIADLAMQVFGFGAIALLVPLIAWGWRLMAGIGSVVTPRRVAFAVMGALAVSGFLAAIHPPANWPLPVGLGGAMGDVLFKLPAALTGSEAIAKLVAIGVFGLIAIAGLVAACGPRAVPAGEDEDDGAPTVAAARLAAQRAPQPTEEFADEDDERDGAWSRMVGMGQHWWLSARALFGRGVSGGRRRAADDFGGGFGGQMSGWLDEQREEPVLARGGASVRGASRRVAPQPPVEAAEPLAFVPTSRRVDPLAEPRRAPAPVAMPDEDDDDDATFEAPLPPQPQPAPVRPRVPVAPVPMQAGTRATAVVVTPPRATPPEPEFEDDDDDGDDPAPFTGSTRVAHGRGSIASVMTRPEPAPMPRVEPSFEPPPLPDNPPPVTAPVRAAVAPAKAPAVAAPAAPAAEERRVPVAPAPRPVEAMKRGAQEPPRRSESGFEFPPLSLLSEPRRLGKDQTMSTEQMQRNAGDLEGVLEDFGVRGEIINVRPGPVVTLYELEPAAGIKSSRVIGLADDIARSMCAVSARVAVVPGRNVIGIELPNQTRETVYLRELAASSEFVMSGQKLAMCLGKTIGGEPVIADLARMPHLLVAGTTGSGKSVAINTMILSLLYRLTPQQCKLIMIDPKMLELSVYDGIPHLLSPVVTDPKKAVVALKWTVREMEDRYRKMSKLGVRNIDGFNARVAEARQQGESLTRLIQTGFDRSSGEPIYEQEELALDPLPYIIVIVDEMADLMMVAGKEIEGAIQRLAQMARAAGIHIIMATQRPSVDVITGTIKANFPTRISFQVTSKIDSRTILGEQGAEQLLGQGDMLYMAGGGRIQRVHGPFVSDAEVEKIVAHLKTQGAPDYLDAITRDDDEEGGDEAGEGGSAGLDALDESADLYDKAVAVVLRDRKASTSYVQRRLQIGYNRAASLIERMEKEGIVGPANHAGKREILVGGDDDPRSYD